MASFATPFFSSRVRRSTNHSLERQAARVREFASANLLRLNAQKCEVVVFGTVRGDVTPGCEVDGCVMPCSGVGNAWGSGGEGICWLPDLCRTFTCNCIHSLTNLLGRTGPVCKILLLRILEATLCVSHLCLVL